MAHWQHRAACRTETDDSIWFPASPADVALAKYICDRCPVRAACLRDALATEGYRNADGRYGIRGGMTPEQRATEHSRLSRAASRKRVTA